MTREVAADRLIAADGTLIPGDMVIITIGETPDLAYLPEGVNRFRDWLLPGAAMSILDGVFAAGDVIKPGRLVDAIGAGSRAAAYVRGEMRTFVVRRTSSPPEGSAGPLSSAAMPAICRTPTGISIVASVAAPAGIAGCAMNPALNRPSAGKRCRTAPSVTFRTTRAVSAAASARASVPAVSGP